MNMVPGTSVLCLRECLVGECHGSPAPTLCAPHLSYFPTSTCLGATAELLIPWAVCSELERLK